MAEHRLPPIDLEYDCLSPAPFSSPLWANPFWMSCAAIRWPFTGSPINFDDQRKKQLSESLMESIIR